MRHIDAARKALRAEYPDAEFYRHQSGYYYFSGSLISCPSIYVWNLDQMGTPAEAAAEVVEHAKSYVALRVRFA